MVMMSNARALLVVVRLATLELKLGTLLRSLERRYNADQPRVPAGSPKGGQWTSIGGSRGAVRIRAALAAKLLTQRVGVGDDRMIRHCIYHDYFGRQFGQEQDAAKVCPPTLTVPPYYGPL
jgi:hypothetical protein